MKTATVSDLLSWNPCSDWSEDRIRSVAGDKAQWTALDVLAMEAVSPVDRLWVVLRPQLIDESVLHELACRFVEETLPLYESQYPGDTSPRDAIAAKRAWLRGEITDEQLAWAAAAADAAWWAAAMSARAAEAAWLAARSAWWAAATDGAAAAAAAADEAWWAAVMSARAAAMSARAAETEARQRQIEIVREVLK